MSSKSTVTKQPARFSRNNLPPSEEEALARIHELNVETSSVAAKLQNANPRNFTSEDAYKEWRSRACIRLNCSHEEISFLERWLRGRQQIAERFELGHTGGDGRGELDPVSERALQLAQEIGRDYAVTYTNSAQPKDLHAAHERLGYLTLVRRQIEAAFSEVSMMTAERPLLQSDVPKVKAPLHMILAKVDAEMAVVKLYIRKQNIAVAESHTKKPSSWKSRALGVLTRVVAEGFVLTEHEQELFTYLQDKTNK